MSHNIKTTDRYRDWHRLWLQRVWWKILSPGVAKDDLWRFQTKGRQWAVPEWSLWYHHGSVGVCALSSRLFGWTGCVTSCNMKAIIQSFPSVPSVRFCCRTGRNKRQSGGQWRLAVHRLLNWKHHPLLLNCCFSSICANLFSSSPSVHGCSCFFLLFFCGF